LTAPARELPHATLEQAAEWYARLRDGAAGERERADWQQWLRAAEEHRIAWRHVEDIGRGFEPLRNMPDSRQAANSLCIANERLLMRRRTLAALAGAGLLGGLGWLGRHEILPDALMARAAEHRTGTGEQRNLLLADGSRVWLNTASAIDIDFNARERRIILVAGEIFIDAAHDAERPFLVDTAQGRLRALGTRFNVRREGGETHLAVYAGVVEIRIHGGASAVLFAGRQARFTARAIAPALPADTAREAWTQGALVADGLTLREVVEELRRYRKGHLGVADEVAGLRVYGNFPVHDTDRVLNMLASALPIRIERPLPWWTSIESGAEE
jgi:transmembrane sensor